MATRYLTRILLLFTGLVSLSALADSKASLKALDKANAQYFEELMKRPSTSTAEKMELKSKILTPAVSAVAKDQQGEIAAQQQHTRDIKTLFTKSTPEQKKAKREKQQAYLDALKDIKELMKNGGPFRNNASSGGNLPRGGQSPGEAIQGPEPAAPESVVLDGSGIPRELEFTGSKKSPAKAPGATAKPTGPLSK